MFSDYPEEKVVLLIPCSSFKILSIDDFYYATKSKNHLCRKYIWNILDLISLKLIYLLYLLIIRYFKKKT